MPPIRRKNPVGAVREQSGHRLVAEHSTICELPIIVASIHPADQKWIQKFVAEKDAAQ